MGESMKRLLTESEAAQVSAKNKGAWRTTTSSIPVVWGTEKCAYCGQLKKHHSANGGFCPIGERHKTIGFTQFSVSQIFCHKLKKPSKSRQKAAGKRAAPALREHEEQKLLVAWWAANARSYRLDPCVLIAIPNGSMLAGDARMRSIQSRRLKDEGVRVGVPDLFLAVQRGNPGGLWLELKRADWKPPRVGTKAYAKYMVQESFHEMLRARGYRVQFAAGHNAAIAAIKDYLQ